MYGRILVKHAVTVGAVVTLLGSCIQNAAAQNSSTVPLASNPIVVVDGGVRFSLAVPERDNREQTNVSAADVPEGVVWMTPPNFPDASDHSIATWCLWLTPQRSTGGNLWKRAKLLHRFSKGSRPTLAGITGDHVLVKLQYTRLSARIYSHSLTSKSGSLLATIPIGAPSSYGYGAYAWVSPSDIVHVVNVSTRRTFSVTISGAYGSTIQLVTGGIDGSGKIVSVTGVDKQDYPSVPRSFKWVKLWHGTQPVIAIPAAWKVTQDHAGGSSIGLTASNPKHPNQKLTLYFNACAGCYTPDIISPQTVDTPFASPLLGVSPHEKYVWLDDQTVAYTVPSSKQSIYPTYGVTRTFTNQSGDEEVTLQLPASEKHLAKVILDSSLRVP